MFCSLAVFLLVFVSLPMCTSFVDKQLASIKEDLYNKQVTFSGLQLTDEAVLKRFLPMDSSVFSWLLHTKGIERALLSHPLISNVSIEQCPSRAWNCFHISVEEGTPKAIVALKDSFWLVGDDGDFLTSIRVDHPDSLMQLPFITGVDNSQVSPDVIKERTIFAVQMINKIESKINRTVERIVLTDNGELKVKFKEYDFTAIFDGQTNEQDELMINDELDRLKTLVANFDGRESLIEELDFAFSTQCVVKLTEQGRALMKKSVANS